MNMEYFENVVNQQMDICKDVLCAKSKEYSTENDKLHNFKNAAGMMGCDPKEALAGMMAKHTISIFDMCRDGKYHGIDIWQEKITDHINYLLLLKALVVEEASEHAEPPFDGAVLYSNDIPHRITYEMKGEKK